MGNVQKCDSCINTLSRTSSSVTYKDVIRISNWIYLLLLKSQQIKITHKIVMLFVKALTSLCLHLHFWDQILLWLYLCYFSACFPACRLSDTSVSLISLDFIYISRTNLLFFSCLCSYGCTAKETHASAIPDSILSVTLVSKLVCQEYNVPYRGHVLQQAGYQSSSFLFATETQPQRHDFRNKSQYHQQKWTDNVLVFETCLVEDRDGQTIHLQSFMIRMDDQYNFIRDMTVHKECHLPGSYVVWLL
jgi:hypothetical protein